MLSSQGPADDTASSTLAQKALYGQGPADDTASSAEAGVASLKQSQEPSLELDQCLAWHPAEQLEHGLRRASESVAGKRAERRHERGVFAPARLHGRERGPRERRERGRLPRARVARERDGQHVRRLCPASPGCRSHPFLR